MTSRSGKPRTSVKASFSDFKWTYYIIFLVECDQISNNFISALNETEISDTRIRVIKKQEILNDLKQKRKPTTPSSTQSSRGKSPKKPAKNGIRDEKLENDEQTIFNLLKGNKDHYLNLPPDSLANVVKQFINKLKISYLENSKTFNSKGSGKITADKKSKNNVDSEDKKKTADSQKSGTDKGKGKQKLALDQVEKLQLPKCLIFTGFYEPLLPVEMAKLGLTVRGIVALKKRTVSSSENVLLLEKETQNFERQLTSKKFNFDFFKFWSYAGNDEVTMVKSEDIADIDIELPEQIAVVFETPKRGKNLSANTKKDLKLNINRFLTNLTTHLLYSLDVYNQNIDNIETYDLDAEYRPLSEAKHYLHLSSLLPYECCDISFVLYNMVDQVSVWHNDKTGNLPEKNKKQQMCIPKIINHNNKIDLRTLHLCTNVMSYYNIHSILQNYLSSNPVFNSWKEIGNKITKKQRELNEFHLRRLFKLGENIDQYLFDMYLHWYILCRMKLEDSNPKRLKELKKRTNCYLNRNRLFRDSIAIKKGTKPQLKVDKWRRFSSMSVKHVNALRKENLKTLKKFIEISEIVELVQNDKIVRKLVSNKDDSLFKYAEDLSPICLLQTIQALTSSFLMCHKLHFKPSNKILVWYHNDIGLTSRKNSFKVDIFLGFRDFYKNSMKEESIRVSNLNENLSEYSSNKTSEGNGDLSFEIKNQADFDVKDNGTETSRPSRIKVCNLWGSEMELETSTHTFVSADSSSVVLDIEHWLNMTKTMKITIKKHDTELIYHKNMLQTHNEERENSIYSNAVLNLPDGTRVCVDIEEKYLPERFLKLFYNFSIVLPSGLSIEVVKNNGDFYVKQKYVFQSTLTESIKNEKYRCYLRAGHVIIFFKNGRTRILYSNGTIVDCHEIVDYTQQTNEGETNLNSTTESEEKSKSIIKKEEKMKKKAVVKHKKLAKKDLTDEQTPNNKEVNVNDQKTPKKFENSSAKTENKQRTNKHSNNDQQPTQESKSLKSEKPNAFSVLKQSVTTAYGERYTYDNGIEGTKKSYSLRTIFQPYQTLYIDRSDGYKALYSDDGSLLSTFPDKTKISTIPDNVHNMSDSCNNLDLTSSLIGVYCRESVEYSNNFLDEDFPDSFNTFKLMTLAEHPLYARVEYNVKQCAIRITLPGGMIMYVMENLNDFIIDVDSITTVIFSKENIVFSCGIIENRRKENITVINSISKTIGLSKQAQKPPIFCKTIDTFGKLFLIHNDGDVELISSPASDDSLELVTNNSQQLARDYYFHDKIPRSQFERFFVVNRDFSGHEFVHKDDVDLFLSENKNELEDANVKVTENPTCGKLKSKTLQYPLFENYFQRYRISYTNLESYYFPENFLRCSLSERCNLNNSLWLFKGVAPVEKSDQTKVFKFKKKCKNGPIAVVYRTLNEICQKYDNKIKKIATVLLSYEERNKELFSVYSRKRFKRRLLLNKLLDN